MGSLETEYETMDEATRITLAFRELAEKSPSLHVLQRYESRLSRQFERCLNRLDALRAARPVTLTETPELLNGPIDPSPENGHSDAAPECVESTPAEASQPASDPNPERRPAVDASEPASAVEGIHPRPLPVDSATRSESEGALPRAA
jgi:hypothetical protein